MIQSQLKISGIIPGRFLPLIITTVLLISKSLQSKLPNMKVKIHKAEENATIPFPTVDIKGCGTFEGEKCSKCYPGYFLDSSGKCESCQSGCKICESDKKCSEAFIGFRIFEGAVFRCKEGCKKCDEKDVCLECLKGTYLFTLESARREAEESGKTTKPALIRRTLLELIGHKANETTPKPISIDMRPEFKDFHDGECVKCPQYCKKCNSVRCLECVDENAFKLSNSGRQCEDLQLKKFKFLALFFGLFLSSLMVVFCCCCVCSCICFDFWLTRNCVFAIRDCFKGKKKNE